MRRRQRSKPRLKLLNALQLKLKQPESKLRPRRRPQRKKLPRKLLRRRRRSKNRHRQQVVVAVIRKRVGRRIKRENE